MLFQEVNPSVDVGLIMSKVFDNASFVGTITSGKLISITEKEEGISILKKDAASGLDVWLGVFRKYVNKL